MGAAGTERTRLNGSTQFTKGSYGRRAARTRLNGLTQFDKGSYGRIAARTRLNGSTQFDIWSYWGKGHSVRSTRSSTGVTESARKRRS